MSSGRSIPRRRTRSEEEDDSDETSSSGSAPANPTPRTTSNPSKRPRLSTNNDDLNDEGSEELSSGSGDDSGGDEALANGNAEDSNGTSSSGSTTQNSTPRNANPDKRSKSGTKINGQSIGGTEDNASESEEGSEELGTPGDGNEDGSVSDPTQADGGDGTQTPGFNATGPQATDVNGTTPEGYKPGAIVRIKVTDFVTYTSAEFFPGPKLNMVIGPNGTGKSTLVCAICLGLGWGPQHLGRAKDTGEYVKHGCREAIIEIELAGGPRYRRNPVVSRTIKRDGNKSSFMINGKQASRQQVLRLAQSFAIQIDNLCQFLPQDKVSEFAALTPIELLNSTQRAAAGDEMVEWHANLKSLRAEQKKLQADNQGDRDLLTNLEERQEMQRADVERMRQRVQIKRKIEMLESARPVTQYKELREQFNEMKRERDVKKEELTELERELEPALRAANERQEYCLKLDDVIKHRTQTFEVAEKKASNAAAKIEQFEEQFKDLDNQAESEKKSGQSHRQNFSKIQQNLNKLRRSLEQDQPVAFELDSYNERIREKRMELREIEEQAEKLKVERRPLLEAHKSTSDQIKQAEEQLKNLDSQAGQQESKLGRFSQDSVKAYQWVRENQARFEKEVFGPPTLTCSVKDPKFAHALESLLQRTDFTAFTTQTRNDFRTLQKALVELRLSDVSIRTCSIPLDRLRPSMSDAQIRELGFDGWASDFLNGPDPVVAMLCSENRLHQTPIRLRDISDEEFTRIENGPISTWVAGKQTYAVTRRREYGPSATSTRVRPVKPAKVWTSQPVDASEKEAIMQRIRSLEEETNELQARMDGDRARLSQLGKRHEDIDNERRAIEQEKGEKQTALTHWRAIPEKIRQEEKKLSEMQRFIDEVKSTVLGIRKQQVQVSMKKAEAVIEYANAVNILNRLHDELIKIKLQHIEGISDLEALKARNVQHQQRLTAKRDEVKKAQQLIKDTTERVKKLYKQAEKVISGSASQPDLAELIPTLANHTMEQLEADIDSEKARLELTHGGNSGVIKEFEERARQIDKLRSKLADFETKLADYNHAINEIRGQWEPKLDGIIKNISEAFSDSFARIGCAGQVTLDKAEEETGPNGEVTDTHFDQWSIQIHVKFREHENLSLLDAHRQSGGERAVSTIFYLMALQSLSASPFRVVDEINQGMDPRNERMVHGRLVDIACAPSDSGGGGQYFLITPKLLSGLTYKPGMRVLCIYSGEHMPEDYNIVNFGDAVKKMRAVAEKNNRGKGKGRAIESARRSNGDVGVYG
ncbi:DNA repair ATPase SMC5 [Aspergillus homomorphus CBS 101889]|uniref:Structural maintenance of chromosomes protein 5 n=1 Tax=Aspergillus homomorphus (strain CBS 101889) TaxID=1450537 RepID=A0A395HSX4_ASPHC|nr:structural maintenance of chromosomes 5 smc5 [Aspergillus homomorphus CBS 101889]RAL11041.1 structural maintenance of chromosomes 5 smc5 [Aspergillus homomorphus CBS 101889]